MPRINDGICVACGGTRLNSHGGPCSPCIANEVFARLSKEREEDAKIIRRREPALHPITSPNKPIKSAIPQSARKLPIRLRH